MQARDLTDSLPVSKVRIWDGSTPWLVTGYEEARSLFSDSRVSVDDRLPGFPHWNAGMKTMAPHRPRSVFTSDSAEHTRFRRMLSKSFTGERVEGLRPVIEKITNEHVDEILAGPRPADIVSAFAQPVSSLVISEFLGVPSEKVRDFHQHATASLARDASPRDTLNNVTALAEFISELVDDKMANPAEDAMSDLAHLVTSGELSREEATALGVGLLAAGHGTTANMISLGTLALLENPTQLTILRDAEAPAIVANAIEELLRYLSIVNNGQRRIALADIDLGGCVIRGGDGIIIDLAPANWDAKAFDEPDVLYLHRSNALQNVAFGYGRHLCVGQQLARAEMQIMFTTLLRRIPTLRLATPIDQIEFKHDKLAFGVYQLPVAW
jgi:cytochrome P450